MKMLLCNFLKLFLIIAFSAKNGCGQECQDQLDTCLIFQASNFCNSPALIDFMRVNCALTCGFCEPEPTWSEWLPWRECDVTCGNGLQQRIRICDDGTSCEGSSSENRSCSNPPCPVWSSWASTGECSTTCGSGTIVQRRTCMNGPGCEGESEREAACNSQPCPECIDALPSPGCLIFQSTGSCANIALRGFLKTNCASTCDLCGVAEDEPTWSDWLPWGECDVTCGNGMQQRIRVCNGGTNCIGNPTESRSCSRSECVGGWTAWTTAGQCPVSCGGGIIRETRNCLNGRGCSGQDSRNIACNNEQCAAWSSWSVSGECSARCNGGIMRERRVCLNGDDCNGQSVRNVRCNDHPCSGSLQPSWSNWAASEQCSVSCGGGNLRETRRCMYGDICDGQRSRNRQCNAHQCPAWAGWVRSGGCSVTCGSGVIRETRECRNGPGCVGEAFKDLHCNARPCPVWGDWWQSGSCSVSCGGGTVLQRRNCNNGPDCEGPNNRNGPCNTRPCPTWSDWIMEGHCSARCGGGNVRERRTCINGPGCQGQGNRNVKCNTYSCSSRFRVELEPTWGEWVNAEGCSATCGNGTISQRRNCLNGPGCVGGNIRSLSCNPQACPEWSSWVDGECSVTCGGGTLSQTRNCTNGSGCVGEDRRSISCTPGVCPDPAWSIWSDWSLCDVTCEEGMQMRSRTCQNGTTCEGNATEAQTCSNGPCPVWTNWVDVTECTMTCGDGTHTQMRNCLNGPGCPGNDTQTTSCNLPPCPAWTNWKISGSCSVTCGGGLRREQRRCVNGNDCEGISIRHVPCVGRPCPVGGLSVSGWSSWSQDGDCSSSCGGGTVRETRQCVNGHGCSGESNRNIQCNPHQCPAWGGWRRDGDCSVTCGPGSISEVRVCVNGPGCIGSDTNSIPCNPRPCPTWSSWRPIGQCSVTCGSGTVDQGRQCLNGPGCEGEDKRTDVCRDRFCPVWSNWQMSGDCSLTCGGGTVREIRTCQYGPGCEGLSNRNVGCNTRPCPHQNCSTAMVGMKGRISSPNYPHNHYPPMAVCEWTVTVPRRYVIKFDFTHMDMENAPLQRLGNCSADWLIIYDGRNYSYPYAGGQKYCGYNIHFNPVYTTSNYAMVEFRSDHSIEKSGFLLEWRATRRPRESFDCNFETVKGICVGWSQSSADDFDWSMQQGPTLSGRFGETGPRYDHTFATLRGTYSYIESTGKAENDTAVLVSPRVDMARAHLHCLTFWYHMNGVGMGSLYVYQVPVGHEMEAGYKIFNSSGNMGHEWIKVQMDISWSVYDAQFMFAGVRGPGFTSDMAIDDITLTYGHCYVTSTTAATTTTTTTPTTTTTTTATTPLLTTPRFTTTRVPCSQDEYRCRTVGNCIPPEWFCDGIQDCLENDDEEDCQPEPTWGNWTTSQNCTAHCGGGIITEVRTCIDGPGCNGSDARNISCNTHLCPEWGTWFSNESCTVTCGGGLRREARKCMNGPGCEGAGERNVSCNTNLCPAWSDWTVHGMCSVSCGGGMITEARFCVNGPGCIGDGTRNTSCNTHLCPEWGRWVKSSDCSVSCGGGLYKETRSCMNGPGCMGLAERNITCNDHLCPVWGLWSAAGTCSVSCGGGMITETRSCMNGPGCMGLAERNITCNDHLCPVWGLWSAAGTCSVSCGGGIITETRSCMNGPGCMGLAERNITCNDHLCPVWGLWSAAGTCSVSCGGGMITETRSCMNGPGCMGLAERNITCNDHLCPVWGLWSAAGTCSVSCGGGIITETRICINGPGCTGGRTRNISCNTNLCPAWGNWVEIGECSVTCVGGLLEESRPCMHGPGCQGNGSRSVSCNTHLCPVWSEWSINGTCSATCGDGTIRETRTCINGPGCIGSNEQFLPCTERFCPVWSRWRKNGDCSVTCGGGTIRQSRTCLYGPGCEGSKDRNVPCNMHQCPLQRACEHRLFATSRYRTISSPSYPSNYPDNLFCNWTITAPANMQILLNINELFTESCCDHVEIYDGSNFLTRFSGELSSDVTIVSYSDTLTVIFQSDVNVNMKGFTARYKQARNCGYNLVASEPSTEISSPHYDNQLNNNLDCMWTLRTPAGTPVQLNITSGSTQQRGDYIEILDGWTHIGRLQGQFSTPQTFTSNGIIMRVYYHTNSSVASEGFEGRFGEDGFFSLGARENCTLLDIALLVDSSSSIRAENFEIVRNFLRRLVSRLTVGLNDTRVSALQFDREIVPLWRFNESTSSGELIQRINAIQYVRSGTHTGKALRHATNHTFTTNEGDRPGVPDLAIVITDGKAQDDPEDAVVALKEHGVHVVAIGVTAHVDIEQINAIASDPDSFHVFFIDDFQVLLGLVDNITTIACARATLTPWSQWEECSHTCGSGTQIRTRTCADGAFGDIGCQDVSTDSRSCIDLPRCPKWLPWTTWTICSASCGGGMTTRTRICIDDDPTATLCDGYATNTQTCNEISCTGEQTRR